MTVADDVPAVVHQSQIVRVDQPAGCFSFDGFISKKSAPEPGENDCRRLARAGRHVDQLGKNRIGGEPYLVGVRILTGSGRTSKQFEVVHDSAHNHHILGIERLDRPAQGLDRRATTRTHWQKKDLVLVPINDVIQASLESYHVHSRQSTKKHRLFSFRFPIRREQLLELVGNGLTQALGLEDHGVGSEAEHPASDLDGR